MFRRKPERTYSLTSYTGVGDLPPNRHLPSPAALAAAANVGNAPGAGAGATRLSSAAAATALRRHSLTNDSQATADRFARTSSITSTSSRRSLDPSTGLPRRSPSTAGSMTRSSSTTTTTTTTSSSGRQGRTMSLTTTTVRSLGSFELITTKTTPLRPPPGHGARRMGPNRSNAYTPSTLSYERELNPVSEEDDQTLVNNTTFFSSPTPRSPPVQSPPAQQRRASLQNNQVAPKISFSHIPDEAPQSTIKHVPPPRSVSPMKPALKDNSSLHSSPSLSDTLDGNQPNTTVRRKRSNRVSFTGSDAEPEVTIIPNYPYANGEQVRTAPSREFLRPQQPKGNTGEAAALMAAKTHNLLGTPASANPRGRGGKPSSTSAAAAAARSMNARIPVGRHDDSDSGNSVYSDAFEDPIETEMKAKQLQQLQQHQQHQQHQQRRQMGGGGAPTLRQKQPNGRPAARPPQAAANVPDIHQPEPRRQPQHHYRALTEFSDAEEDVDAISLNSDSSWKKERAAAKPSTFRMSLRDGERRQPEYSGFEEFSEAAPQRPGSSMQTRPPTGGFRTHSLRSNTVRPDFSHLDAPPTDLAQQRTSFERDPVHKAPSRFSRLTMRESQRAPQPAPRPEVRMSSAPTAHAPSQPFRSRFQDSDSEDEGVNLASTLGANLPPPRPIVSNSGAAESITSSPTSKLKGVFSPSHSAKILVPKQSGVSLRMDKKMSKKLQKAQISEPIPEVGVAFNPRAGLTKVNPDGSVPKKKKFPGLRRAFGLD